MMPRTTRSRSAYTLLEVILALTLFGIIMSAMALAVSAGLRAFTISSVRQQETMDIRGVFHFLNQDLQATFASGGNPASLFVGNGGLSGGTSGTSGILTFTTLSHRITGLGLSDASASTMLASASGSGAQANSSLPQSDVELVRYEFDAVKGTLSRITVAVPNISLVGKSQATPETQIAQHVESINLRFWDNVNRNWRSNWDYQQRNRPQPSQDQQGPQGGGANGEQGGNQGGNSGSSNQATGDRSPPSAVEVTVTMRRGDGSLSNLVTTIPILAPKPVTNSVTTPVSSNPSGAGGDPSNDPQGPPQ